MESTKLVDWLEAAVVHTPGFASPGQARSTITAVKDLAAEHIKLSPAYEARAITLLVDFFGDELVNAVLERDRARSQLSHAKVDPDRTTELLSWLSSEARRLPGFSSHADAVATVHTLNGLATAHTKDCTSTDAKTISLLLEYLGGELCCAVGERDRAILQHDLARQTGPSLPGGSAGDPTANHVSATVAGGLTPDDWHREYDRLEQIASEERERADSQAQATARLRTEVGNLLRKVEDLTRELNERRLREDYVKASGSTDTPPATLAHLEQRLEMFAGTFNLSCKAHKEIDDYTRAAIAELRGVCRDLGDRITAIEKTIPFEPIKRRV